MFKSLFRDRLLTSLLVATILIKLFSLNAHWVERYYTFGFYPFISGALRAAFGWIPFSIGDLLYFLAFGWVGWKTWVLVRLLIQRRLWQHFCWMVSGRYLKLALCIYIIFNLF